MNLLILIEILATTTSLAYLFLLIRQNVWCWPLAIISAILSIYLFIDSKLYAEAILYGYFILISAYGWWNWSRPKGPTKISTWKYGSHLVTLLTGAILSMTLGYALTYFTDADKPYLDATTTIFSFIASIMEARKVLSAWVYWMVINGVTVGLYSSKSLDIYAAVMVVYFVMSVVGYIQWRKSYYRG